MKRLHNLLFIKVKPYIWVKRFLREGELGDSLAERTRCVDPLNLIRVMPAEGQDRWVKR